MSGHEVFFGDKKIYFDLIRKDVKNINLNIRPDTSIMVSANDKVPLEVIMDFVRKKGPWLTKNINYFERFQPQEKNKKEYVSGESFKYLGRQYRLRVRNSKDDKVKYFRGFIYLYTEDVDDLKKKERLYKVWLREKAVLHYNDSLKRMHELVRNYDIPKPGIKIRDMKTRWGSCHRHDKIIILNSELIKAPKHCIDYVVLHELLHFKYKNHDKEFYGLLTILMPDWEKRKNLLDEEVVKGL